MLPSHNPIGNQLESSPIPTSANSASAGNSVAGPVGSGPSGRKAAEVASCCEVVGPQYMGPTGPTASWKPSVAFSKLEKENLCQKEQTRMYYICCSCAEWTAWWACAHVLSHFCFDRLMLPVWSDMLWEVKLFSMELEPTEYGAPFRRNPKHYGGSWRVLHPPLAPSATFQYSPSTTYHHQHHQASSWSCGVWRQDDPTRACEACGTSINNAVEMRSKALFLKFGERPFPLEWRWTTIFR